MTFSMNASGSVIIGLGKIAHDAVLRALDLRLASYPFGHGRSFRLADGKLLVDSYHCSRYNTQTRRLTGKMFADVFRRIRETVDPHPSWSDTSR